MLFVDLKLCGWKNVWGVFCNYKILCFIINRLVPSIFVCQFSIVIFLTLLGISSTGKALLNCHPTRSPKVVGPQEVAEFSLKNLPLHDLYSFIKFVENFSIGTGRIYNHFIDTALTLYPNPTGVLRRNLKLNMHYYFMVFERACEERFPYGPL